MTSTEKTSMDGSGAMFDTIASRYDTLNRIISFGLDKSWRRKAIQMLGIRNNDTILDLATGTADLALEIAETHPHARVEGLDPSEGMLACGRDKAQKANLSDRVNLVCGDGQNMPFEDNTFDGIIIGFGIRNFPDRMKGLREMCRVTKPGRKVVILELSEPRDGIMSIPARFHIHVFVPAIGRVVAGSEAYRYLQKSIQAFPPAPEFANMMTEAGLTDVTFTPVTFGVAHIYCGTAT